MQKLKTALKAYFTFGKRDRIGIIGVILLIAIIYALPYLFAKKNEPFTVKQTDVLAKAVDTLVSKQKTNYYAKENDENENSYQFETSETKNFTKGELFQFDPNTLSVEGWQKLGLSEKTSKTINKYRSKGGKFYKPEDIKKILMIMTTTININQARQKVFPMENCFSLIRTLYLSKVGKNWD